MRGAERSLQPQRSARPRHTLGPARHHAEARGLPCAGPAGLVRGGARVGASVQEYIRARAAGLGVSEVGIVTIAERPVRASFVFVVLIALQFDFSIYDQIIICWLVLQLISLFMLTRFTYSKLR